MGRLDDPHFEGRLLLAAADFITVLLLTAGSALAFLSGYDVITDLGAVLVFCAAASAVSVAVHSRSRPWWAAASAAGIAAVCWLARKQMGQVLEWLAMKMGVLYLLPLDWQRSSPDSETVLPCLLLLCAVLAWIMGWMAVRVRRWYLAALLSLILILPAIQMGVLPSWGALLAVFAGWGSMLLNALYGRRDPGSLGRAQLLSLTGMSALILLLAASLPMEGYVRPQWATDARTSLILGVRHRLERFFDMEALESGILADLGIDLSVPGEGGGQGSAAASVSGVSGGVSGRREDLLAAGPRQYSGRHVLSVSTDQPEGGRIYLRGGSLGIYTGESWEMVEISDPYDDEIPEEEEQSALYAAQTAADRTEYAMDIRDYYYSGVRFYPYRLTNGRGWTDEAGNLTLPESAGWLEGIVQSRREEYQVDYIPGGPEDGFVPLTGQWAEAERQYMSMEAYEAYLSGQDVIREELAVSGDAVLIPAGMASAAGRRYAAYLDVPGEAQQILRPLLGRDYWDGWAMVIASLQQQAETAEGDEREALEESLQQIRDLMNKQLTLEDFDGAEELPDGMEQFRYEISAAQRTAALLEALAVYDLDTPAMEPGEDFVTHFLEEGRGYCVHFATTGALLLRMQGVPARYVAGYTVQLDGQGRGEALDSDAHAWVEIYLEGYGWYPVEMTPGYAGGETGADLTDGSETEEREQPDEPAPEEDAPEEELPEEEPGQVPQPGDEPGQEDAPEEEAPASGLRRALAGLGLTLCGLGAAYALALAMRRRERTETDVNRSAIRAYRRYQRVLRLGGVENETLEELGRKAKFSQHTLTEEERETAWRCLDEAVKTAEKRQKKSRRWLLPLLRPVL